jgi:hypothetical protein
MQTFLSPSTAHLYATNTIKNTVCDSSVAETRCQKLTLQVPPHYYIRVIWLLQLQIGGIRKKRHTLKEIDHFI